MKLIIDRANLIDFRRTEKNGQIRYWATFACAPMSQAEDMGQLKVMSERVDLTALPSLVECSIEIDCTPLVWGTSPVLRVDAIMCERL